MIKKLVSGLVDWSGRHPIIILFLTLGVLGGSWWYGSHLELRPDFQELLPRDSPSYKAFETQLGRLGGGATIIVIAESPDTAANRKYIDDFADRLEQQQKDEHQKCEEKCKADAVCMRSCGLIAYIERGSKGVRKFFEDNKWLYADIADLRAAEREVDHQVAYVSKTVPRLFDEDEPAPAPAPSSPAPKASGSAPGAPSAPPSVSTKKKPALGLDEYRERWDKKAKDRPEYADFPYGYFETKEGTMAGLRVISNSTGMGDSAGDTLLARVQALMKELDPAKYNPQMQVGLGGDVPNAVAEKESIVSDALIAFVAAIVLLLGGIIVFYKSFWSLFVVFIPAFVGVGCAYAFAMARFGYVNTAGAFLGAIILGNGINYPIVLLSRYREFRARGQAPADARRDAVWNAFRAELVGACVGSIAYGSLTITQFRGFSQFGMIGFVGMILVWLSMIPLVPALLVIIEWIQSKLPKFLRDPIPKIKEDGSRGPITRAIANATERRPWLFIGAAFAVTAFAVYAVFIHKGPPAGPSESRLPYIQDPWEYNFDRLGSRGSKHGGAGEWSNKAEKIFQKINVAGAAMLANEPDQVPLIKEKIFENDARDPYGRLIKDVVTVNELLPGTLEEQKEKLVVLEELRQHLTPRVLYDLEQENGKDERKRVEELYPPESLKVLGAADLPDLLRRRFEEKDGRTGNVFYVKFWNFASKGDISHSDGYTLVRIANTTAHVTIPDVRNPGQTVTIDTASRAAILSEMIKSMERDGPLATGASFVAVMIVVIIATHTFRGSFSVLLVLLMGVLWLVAGAAIADVRLNFLNFIALPITFGIGCEYPFNVYDRSRLLGGDVTASVKRVGGAVALCSYTTIVGYSSFLFSDQQALQSFGHLAMSGEIACLTGALLVLPAMLHVMEKKTEKAARLNAARFAAADTGGAEVAPPAAE